MLLVMSKKAQRKALAAAKKAGAKNVNTAPKRQAPVYIPAVNRPFEGFEYEVEIAAMRELIPAATLKLHTTKDYGDTDAYLVTLAPDQVQGLVTQDGRILVALQTQAHSQDAAHDIALVLSKLIDAEPGTVINGMDVRQQAPTLRDMIASESDFTIHTDFRFWFGPDDDIPEHINDALDQAAAAMVPTRAIDGVRGAYWCQMNHQFIRWVRPEDETAVLNGLARLLADKKCVLTDGSRAIGAFRMMGLLTPVWQLDDDTTFEDAQKAVQAFDQQFSQAIADDTPLTPAQRRARDGFIAREVSLR